MGVDGDTALLKALMQPDLAVDGRGSRACCYGKEVSDVSDGGRQRRRAVHFCNRNLSERPAPGAGQCQLCVLGAGSEEGESSLWGLLVREAEEEEEGRMGKEARLEEGCQKNEHLWVA